MSDTDRAGEEAAQPPDDSMKVVILVLGVVGIAFCQLLGPVALLLAWAEYRKAQWAGRDADPMILVGLALGAASTLMLLMGLLFAVAIGVVYCGLAILSFLFTFGIYLLAFLASLAGV